MPSNNQESGFAYIGGQFGTRGSSAAPGTTTGGMLDDIQAGSSNVNGNGGSNNSPRSPPWSPLNPRPN
ncbi:hypothetical protein N7528_007543 [Penicillium herquei]|nr:hypothetical protein N7528_007543 [Penicillium herquei]